MVSPARIAAPSSTCRQRPEWAKAVGCLLVAIVLVGGVVQPAIGATKRPRFKMSLDASTLTVGRNGSSSVTVLVTRVGSFEGPIKLTSSTRKGLKMAFDENPLEGDDTDLVATADATATIGSTTLTVSGSDGRTTVKVRLKVKVTAGLPAVAAATPSTLAATTVAATTLAGTTTIGGGTTTAVAVTTIAAASTTTTGPPAAFGDLIITRTVSQTTPCVPALPAGTVNANVRVSVTNTDATARVLSWVVPGACSETVPTTPFTLASAGIGVITIPFGSYLIARSAGTAGNPIRRVMAVVDPTSLSFIVSSTANLTVQCSAGTTTGGLLVPLADGQRFVLNTVPAGASCTVKAQFDTTPSRSVRDNSGIATDNTAQVAGRPAACAIAAPSTPLPGPAGCYAEFVHNS